MANASITPEDGPVAITGASGYIGSWIVQDCVEQGYTVHACVRDTSKPDKVNHLSALNEQGLGKVILFESHFCVYPQPGPSRH